LVGTAATLGCDGRRTPLFRLQPSAATARSGCWPFLTGGCLPSLWQQRETRGIMCPLTTGTHHENRHPEDRTAGDRCAGIVSEPPLLAARGATRVPRKYT